VCVCLCMCGIVHVYNLAPIAACVNRDCMMREALLVIGCSAPTCRLSKWDRLSSKTYHLLNLLCFDGIHALQQVLVLVHSVSQVLNLLFLKCHVDLQHVFYSDILL